MRRAVPTSPISPKMLRHFAILATVITASLAMFASGENQEFVVEKIERHQAQLKTTRAQREAATKRTVVVDGMRIAPGMKMPPADVTVEYFETDAGPGGVYEPPADTTPNNLGFVPDGVASREPVKPEEIERDINGAPTLPRSLKPGQKIKKAKPPPPPTQAHIDAMLEASRRRTGESTAATDDE